MKEKTALPLCYICFKSLQKKSSNLVFDTYFCKHCHEEYSYPLLVNLSNQSRETTCPACLSPIIISSYHAFCSNPSCPRWKLMTNDGKLYILYNETELNDYIFMRDLREKDHIWGYKGSLSYTLESRKYIDLAFFATQIEYAHSIVGTLLSNIPKRK